MPYTPPKFENVKTLGVEDLYGLMDYTKNYNSSADNIHTYSQSPIHVMIYNEILKYSAKELENVGHPEDEMAQDILGKNILWSLMWRNRNSLFFSAFLKQGAFLDKLTETTRWLLKEIPEPSFDLYETMHMYEEHMRKRSQFLDIRYERDSISAHILWFAKKIDTDEKKILLDKYFEQQKYEDKETILREVFQTLDDHESSVYLLNKMKKDGWDINEGSLLNDYLPQDGWNTGKFFISSDNNSKIQKRIDLGFKFDEKDYVYQEKNLMTAVLSSGRMDLCKLIIPHLKEVRPINLNLDEQTDLLELYKDSKGYKDLKILYSQVLFENLIQENVHNQTNQKKIKV